MTVSRTTVPHRERLLLAGDELMVEYGNFDFGVREVVERAQVSLRTFYQYFDTRDDFALAIHTELTRQHADAIAQTMPKGARITQFRHFVRAMVCPTEWSRLFEEFSAEEAIQRSRALVREGFHLREVRPDAAQAAIAPLRDILIGIIGKGADHDVVTIVLNSLVFGAYDVLTDGLDAEQVAASLVKYHKRALGL